jgi:predicted nucleic acid-binding protein
MAKRYRQSDITTLTGRRVFFDTNVLLYIFWPLPAASFWVQQYSKMFRGLLAQNNSLILNVTILSEVINNILRTEYKNHKDETGINLTFKEYRDCSEGKSALTDIHRIIVNKIFPHFEICDKLFCKNEVQEMLQVDTLDFNDKLIAAVCEENQFVLFTNDADLKNSNIDI